MGRNFDMHTITRNMYVYILLFVEKKKYKIFPASLQFILFFFIHLLLLFISISAIVSIARPGAFIQRHRIGLVARTHRLQFDFVLCLLFILFDLVDFVHF